MSSRRTQKRGDIIRLAGIAFSAHGFRATAIDRVLAESGISKRTLYKYFRSKEELIAAVVKDYQEEMLASISAAIGKYKEPKDKILALFDMRKDILKAGDYSGCLAANARAEFRDEDEGIAASVSGFYQTLLESLQALCRQAGCLEEEKTARQILILLTGASLLGQSLHDPAMADDARQAASFVLEWAVKT
ncbi:MAG: TetR/AcrR family transcriptional regulator [Alphaproteobacteria bacterium]|nr:TetR/AcrR family transcriptional regulator [Alphaproteobacteria bacterium]